MRHEGRHVDKVARAGFGDELERIAPAHACLSGHDVDDTFHGTMVVCAGLGLRVNDHGAGPKFFCAHPRMRDRSSAVHSLSLCSIRVELAAFHDPHTVVLPFRFGHVHSIILAPAKEASARSVLSYSP